MRESRHRNRRGDPCGAQLRAHPRRGSGDGAQRPTAVAAAARQYRRSACVRKRGAAVERPAHDLLEGDAGGGKVVPGIDRGAPFVGRRLDRELQVGEGGRRQAVYPSRARTPDRTVSKGSRMGPHAAHARVTVGTSGGGCPRGLERASKCSPLQLPSTRFSLCTISPSRRTSSP